MNHNISLLDPTYNDEVNKLVSDAFDYIAPSRFFDDFPIWNQKLNTGSFSFGIISNDKIISHVGLKKYLVYQQDKIITVSAIGGVATDRNHRGQGLSTRLMKHVLNLCDQDHSVFGAKTDLTLLWGSEHEYYSKFGFQINGAQLRFPLQHLQFDSPKKSNTSTPNISKNWNDKIFTELKNRKWGMKFSDQDHGWVSQQSTVDWYTLSEPFAFIGMNRGMDLPNIIHEWGGDVSSLGTLIQFIANNTQNTEWMIHPAQLEPLCKKWNCYLPNAEIFLEHFALMRINPNSLHASNLASQLDQVWVSGLAGV